MFEFLIATVLMQQTVYVPQTVMVPHQVVQGPKPLYWTPLRNLIHWRNWPILVPQSCPPGGCPVTPMPITPTPAPASVTPMYKYFSPTSTEYYGPLPHPEY